GVPSSGVSAVVMNVTVTNPNAASFLTTWPGGQGQPTASNLNYTAGQTIANRVIVPVGANGQVNIYNAFGTADVIADVNGYFTDSTASGGQLLLPVSPVRIKDTRSSADTLGPGGKVPVPVATGPIPTNATAAVLNVTATSTT